MKLLVTGGAGFIGSNFIHYIARNYPDYDIVNFDRLTYAGNLANVAALETNPHYRFIRGDIADREQVRAAVAGNDIIVNFAAESHVDRSIIDSGDCVRTNVLGTQVLLEAARAAGNIRFHHVSTDEVFGSLGPTDPAFTEETPYAPQNPYSASKAGADHLARAYFHTYGLPVTISNCSNNYGPFQFPEKLHALFITNLLEGKKVPLYGDGRHIRDWLYVEDHCRALDAIIHRGTPGETYCIGGHAEKTNEEIAKTLLSLLRLPESMIEHVPDRMGHDRRYAINASKIQRELGWEPQIDFTEGMKRTVDWYRENEAWWRDAKSGEYQKWYAKRYGNQSGLKL